MAHIFSVIMAGGVGSRFWPRSRERSPKQLLELTGSGTMVQNTIARIEPLVPSVNTLVVTNALQSDEIVKQLPFIPKENILVEPVGRNTAPCVGLAASWVSRMDPQGVMIVLPADHVIQNVPEFLRVLTVAISIAEETGGLVTIGIKPSHPETGYGYIQFSDDEGSNRYRAKEAYRVKTFAEKPNLETAERFLKSGDFLWNSGMFVWKAESILAEIGTHLPELSEQLKALAPSMGTAGYGAALEQAYGLIRGISIDYGVMEKAGNVYVVKGDFGWSDVGSWDEAVRLSKPDEDGNVKKGSVISRNSRNNFIQANSKIVATIGVEDLIIVSTEDAVLVCKKGQSQDVKEIVDYIRRKQMNEYL
ncbi:MAG: mannose-1-phosphate guanylyltransferase [Ignavibacteriales bacterium]|nr:mannose-1-phosphate guanylyltransferase [Ignavibacteriales bacterium]